MRKLVGAESYWRHIARWKGAPGMARFIKLAITDLNDDGEPLFSVADEWVNLDQVTSIKAILSNNLARRHQLGGTIAREFYPMLEIITSDRHTRLISLGSYPDAPTGMAAIHTFLPTLTESAPATEDVDVELARLIDQYRTE